MKILASDFDGTLYYEGSQLAEDIQAIKEFRAAGNRFGIVSGRSMESLKEAIMKYKIPFDFLVLNNGGIIYDENEKLIDAHYLNHEQAIKIIKHIKTLTGVGAYVINDGYYRHKFVVDQKSVDFKYSGLTDESASEVDILAKTRIAQIVISLSDEHQAKKIAQNIHDMFAKDACAYVNTHCIDIVPVNISKGNALMNIVEMFGVCKQCVHVIGDSYNDLSMIQNYQGYAMKWAPKEVLDQAIRSYVSVKECIENIQ